MKVLVACEESQAVCKEFRKLGHEAYSCDILPCSGGHPEWHIQGDVLPLLNGDCVFKTSDKMYHCIRTEWDMIIAFPPCTYLANSGNRWFNIQKYGDNAVKRYLLRNQAVQFFMSFVNAKCKKIVIENPIGHMSSQYRKPDQIIHPYYFGDAERKATCLWLKGVSPLKHYPENYVTPNIIKFKNGKGTTSKWHMDTISLNKRLRSIIRSKTFPGIARAMAEQWGNGQSAFADLPIMEGMR
jgi:hypothetical protein